MQQWFLRPQHEGFDTLSPILKDFLAGLEVLLAILEDISSGFGFHLIIKYHPHDFLLIIKNHPHEVLRADFLLNVLMLSIKNMDDKFKSSHSNSLKTSLQIMQREQI